MIERLTQRLFTGKTSSQLENHKTMAELVNDFHHNTRVYDHHKHHPQVKSTNKENPTKGKDSTRMIPRAPKLLAINRNRNRTVLSHLEQEEEIAENIRKNTFKANPINKRLFDKSIVHHHNTTTATTQKPANITCKSIESKSSSQFNLRSDARREARKMQKMVAEKENDDENRFVFKARPMPNFKAIQMRPFKKQNSDQQLKKSAVQPLSDKSTAIKACEQYKKDSIIIQSEKMDNKEVAMVSVESEITVEPMFGDQSQENNQVIGHLVDQIVDMLGSDCTSISVEDNKEEEKKEKEELKEEEEEIILA